MFDLLIVGAGITAATLVARLKSRYRIAVVDTRQHLGGNCADYATQGTLVHQYGPHLFHTPNREIVEFLGRYTNWVPYTHSVTAEIEHEGELRRCSFPYSRQAAQELGVELTPEQVVDRFFKGYSRKMWGREWEQLPASITSRVPKDTQDRPLYFPGQFVALPEAGYTEMLRRMFEGVELILGAHEHAWTEIAATRVVYCGRPDRIPVPQDPARRMYGNLARDKGAHWLEYVSLNLEWRVGGWGVETPVLNFCHRKTPYTRFTRYSALTGGSSSIIGLETPVQMVPVTNTAPYYPVPTQENQDLYRALSTRVLRDYPNMVLAGRLGKNQYLDMHQAVGAALALSEQLISG